VRRNILRFTGVLLVGGVAVVALVIVVLLGLPTQPDRTPGVPAGAVEVTVGDTPISRPVAPGFLGLSLEYTTVPAFAGPDPAHVNPVFVRLLRDLTPAQRMVLRIGGDSTDWGWWPAAGLGKPPGIRYALTPSMLKAIKAVKAAAHARLILGLNLEANDPRLTGAEARALIQNLGQRSIAAFELGNEPEVYGAIGYYQNRRGREVHARRRHYAYRDYLREFSRFSHVVPAGIPLAGPATGGPRWSAQLANFARRAPRARVITFHLYPLHRCYVHGRNSPIYPSIPHLLAPRASSGLAGEISPAVGAVHAAGAQLRIDELNSVSCGGARGVSDRFASALWALSALLDLAHAGVDGVNVHTSTQTIYRPFSFTRVNGQWAADVAPEYYGLLAFARSVPAGSRLLEVSRPAASTTLRVWALRTPGGRTRTVLINTSPTTTKVIALRAERKIFPIASVLRLTAPGVAASTGIRLGGQHFPPGTTTGLLAGRRKATQLEANRSGFFLFRVPPASAAIVDLSGSL
jgi:hypothetical protein